MTSNAMIARKSETRIAVIMLDVATFARSLLWHIFDSAMTVAELIRHNENKGIVLEVADCWERRRADHLSRSMSSHLS
jgi:hypothetical protein